MILRRQEGIASIVSVTFTAFLILILTIAIATFMNGELQHATDTVDSIKAYFNAQSATEEAILAVKGANPALPLSSINQGCGSDTIGASEGPIIPGMVCRQVATNAEEAIDTLDNNNVVQFDLTNSASQPQYNINRVILEWDMKFPPAINQAFSNPSGIANASESSWPAGAPPVMELTATNYFPGQQTSIDTTSSGSVFLLPQWQCTTANCPAQFDFKAAYGSSPVVPSACAPVSSEGGYRCYANLYNVAPPGYKTVLRLESRFGDASYDLKAYDYANVQAQLPLQSAQIDVTDNVGQAFRRVQIEVPVRSAVYPGFETLYGDASLCKTFDIEGDPAHNATAVPSALGGICPFNN